jgi:ubiquinone/menaquinone biosynthesis C-methylase UbiE
MPEAQYGRLSLWRDTAGLAEAQARQRVARLELRGGSSDEVEIRSTYLDLLGIAPGERVLEVGCGSGIVLRDIARRVVPNGAAIGVDPSAALLRVARELAGEAGVADVVDLREADGRSLPFGEGEFDAVLAATVLSHVPDAGRAVTEMIRVTRAGGRVAVYDIDGDSMILSHPDRSFTRRITTAHSDRSLVDSWLMRRLPGLFSDAGLRNIRVRAFTPLERDPRGFYATIIEQSAEAAARDGLVSEEEKQRWLDQLHAEQAAGRFLAGLTHLFVYATVPQRPI